VIRSTRRTISARTAIAAIGAVFAVFAVLDGGNSAFDLVAHLIVARLDVSFDLLERLDHQTSLLANLLLLQLAALGHRAANGIQNSLLLFRAHAL
jgi:hypothetical protein